MESLSAISIYKLKEGILYEQVIIKEKLEKYFQTLKEESFHYKEYDIKAICFQAKSIKEENPPWLNFLNEQLEEKIFIPSYSFRANGLIYFEKENRAYICPFGHSVYSIFDKELVVPDFGVKVTMNKCGNSNVRETKSKTHSSKTKQISRQSSSATSSYFFDMEQSEIIKSITAHPEETKNKTFSGSNSLKIRSLKDEKLNWDSLIEAIEESENLYKKEDYKNLFPNFENFKEVTPDKKNKLDALLIERICSNNFKKTHLSIPEFLSDDDIGFTYSASRTARKDTEIVYPFLDINQLIDQKIATKENLTIDYLSSKKIYAYNYVHREILSHKYWNVYSCLVSEIEDGDSSFILSGGVWVEINNDLYLEINRKSDAILNMKKESDLTFGEAENFEIFTIRDPNKASLKNEERFFINSYCNHFKNESIKFDRTKNSIGSSSKKFEFCDILTLDHDANIHVLHIKRYDRGLLKVFDQTRLYSESIIQDKNFLLDIEKNINESENKDHDLFLESILNSEKRFNQENVSVVIWILYDESIKNLSFMERYELIRTKDLITNKLGYKNFHIQYIKVDANKVVKIANGS